MTPYARLSRPRRRSEQPPGAVPAARPKMSADQQASGAVMPTVVPTRLHRHQLVGELLLLRRETRVKRFKRGHEARLVVGTELGELGPHFHPLDRILGGAVMRPGGGNRLIERLRVLAHRRRELLPGALLRRRDFQLGLQKGNPPFDQLPRRQPMMPRRTGRPLLRRGGGGGVGGGLGKSGGKTERRDAGKHRRRRKRVPNTRHNRPHQKRDDDPSPRATRSRRASYPVPPALQRFNLAFMTPYPGRRAGGRPPVVMSLPEAGCPRVARRLLATTRRPARGGRPPPRKEKWNDAAAYGAAAWRTGGGPSVIWPQPADRRRTSPAARSRARLPAAKRSFRSRGRCNSWCRRRAACRRSERS